MTIDRLIKRQMKFLGWNPKRLILELKAMGFEYTVSSVYDWISGKHQPNLHSSIILSRALRFSLDEVSLTNE